MNYKVIAVICGILCAASFFVGRYLTPPDVKETIKIVKEVEVQEKVRTVTRIVERPDGTKETIIDQDKEKNTQTDITKDKDKEVTQQKSRSNLSLLGGVQPKLFGDGSLGPIVIGASWQTQPVGFLPVTLGIWGLVTTPAVGISVGWNY